MKKLLSILTALFLFSCNPAFAQSTTQHFSFIQPQIGQTSSWGLNLNSNFASIDTYLWDASGGMTIGVNAPSSSSTITLTNPIDNVQNITLTSTGQALVLPAMNATSSPVAGGVIYVNNVGSDAFEIFAQDGSTVVLTSLLAGQSVALQVTSNGTANGTYNVYGPYLTAVGTLNLGTSASATNPQRSGQAGTGFYSDTSDEAEVAIGGSNVITWASTGQTDAGYDTATAFIPSGSSIPANGLYLPSSNTPSLAANSKLVAEFLTSGTAVNYFTFTNAATTDAPVLAIAGSDTNISLDINPKGNGAIIIGASTGTKALDLSASTNSILLPSGTSAQRPSPTAGMLRYNSTTSAIEGYFNSAWNSLGIATCSFGSAGYCDIGGLYIEWNNALSPGSNWQSGVTWTFPTAFPNTLYYTAFFPQSQPNSPDYFYSSASSLSAVTFKSQNVSDTFTAWAIAIGN